MELQKLMKTTRESVASHPSHEMMALHLFPISIIAVQLIFNCGTSVSFHFRVGVSVLVDLIVAKQISVVRVSLQWAFVGIERE